ncbi:hypothetical protein EUX98_g2793 [Antrodiella citrinella]|uniref:Protein SQS1 n=1 Tax=Antrodiella citrinella TaxID=2447956 RepID=A0A4V3XJ27_9APHY|nr:hypothetical protein EUX98_g2793 [Antrodiella citrinella]
MLDRPFLRPIKFVRGVHTATLFKDEEELLKPIQELTTDNISSHVPTADKIAHIFSGDAEREAEEDDASGEEGLEEIDFSEVGRIQAEVDAVSATRPEGQSSCAQAHPGEEHFTGFYVDTKPAQSSMRSASIAVEHMKGIIGDQDDEEVIVYVAPHPRAGPVTPPAQYTSNDFTSNVSILTGLVHSSLTVAEYTVPASEPILVSNPSEDSPPTTTAIDSTSTTSISEHIDEEQTAEDENDPFTATDAVLDGPSGYLYDIDDIEYPDPESLPPPPAAFMSDKPIIIKSASPVLPEPELSAQSPESAPVAGLSHDGTPHTSSAAEVAEEIAAPAPPTFESISFSFADSPTKKQLRRIHPASSPRSLIPKRRGAPRRKSLRHFSTFGAMVSEQHLRDEVSGREIDPRRAEQRRGDSDVYWGDDSDEDDVALPRANADVDQISDGMGGMDLDGDLDVNAMRSFVMSMGAQGSSHVTMDDLADMERMKMEDEEDGDSEDEEGLEDASESEGEDEEVETVVRLEEQVLTGEGAAADMGVDGDDDEYETSDDEDEGDSPRRNFAARLEKLRSKVKGKQKAKTAENDEEAEDFDMELETSWADNDEAYLAHIQDMLDANQEVLSGKNRKKRSQLFRAIQDGDIDFDEYEEMMGKPAKRKKDKNMPPELKAQWEKDREKKAENKRKRDQARLEAAADPLTKKKGGKKGMKDMLRVSRLDDTIELPHRIVNVVTLEKEIRRFLENIGGPASMALPPADKATRKNIHELANAFNLNSVSKGKGSTRYTTLVKTTKSGMKVNEKKVGQILRTVDRNWIGPDRRGGGSYATSLAQHREGEEVGKAAPKIGESNIGFKMLAAMGWTEGNQIGLSGGLNVPLVAVMKKTKLGLAQTIRSHQSEQDFHNTMSRRPKLDDEKQRKRFRATNTYGYGGVKLRIDKETARALTRGGGSCLPVNWQRDTTRKVTDDILHSVFKLVHNGDPNALLILSHVCSRWRALLESHWTHTTFYLARGNRKKRVTGLFQAGHQIAFGHEMAPDRPYNTTPPPSPKMSATIDGDWGKEAFPQDVTNMRMQDVMSGLLPCIHGMRKLVVKSGNLDSINSVFTAWRPQGHGERYSYVSKLRQLVLYVRDWRLTSKVAFFANSIVWPDVTSLTVPALGIGRGLLGLDLPIIVPSLQRLTITDFNERVRGIMFPTELAVTLSLSKNLTYLTLDRIGLDEWFTPDPKTARWTPGTGPDTSNTDIGMLQLQELHFSRMIPGFIYEFLGCLYVPKLKAITFEGVPDDVACSTQIFRNLERQKVRRYPLLDTIRFIDFHPSMFCKVARYMTFVRKLMLCAPLGSSRTEHRNWVNWVYERMQTRDTQGNYPLPNMEALHVESVSTVSVRVLYNALVWRADQKDYIVPLQHLTFGGMSHRVGDRFHSTYNGYFRLVAWNVHIMTSKFSLPTRVPHFGGPGSGSRYAFPATYNPPNKFTKLADYN